RDWSSDVCSSDLLSATEELVVVRKDEVSSAIVLHRVGIEHLVPPLLDALEAHELGHRQRLSKAAGEVPNHLLYEQRISRVLGQSADGLLHYEGSAAVVTPRLRLREAELLLRHGPTLLHPAADGVRLQRHPTRAFAAGSSPAG